MTQAETRAKSWLAPDDAVPQRDQLLDAEAMAPRLARLLGGGAVDVTGCERAGVKYKVGRHLLIVYRLELAGAVNHVGARSYTGGGSEAAFERGLPGPAPQGCVRAIAHDAELDTLFWTLPYDPKITSLPALATRQDSFVGMVPAGWARSTLVQYVPQLSAVVRCEDAGGRALAYVKVYAEEGGERSRRVYESVLEQCPRTRLRVPKPLVYSVEHRALVLEPIAGLPLNELRGEKLEVAMLRVGAALAALHEVRLPGLPPFRLHAMDSLEAVAASLARVRPDVAWAADRLVAELASAHPAPPADMNGPSWACLHGDLSLANAIVAGGPAAFVDLEEVAAGPPAADLGRLLAKLRASRYVGTLSPALAGALEAAVLDGYGTSCPVPDPEELRWHTAAALLDGCLRAVSCLKTLKLRHLDGMLDEARRMVTGHE